MTLPYLVGALALAWALLYALSRLAERKKEAVPFIASAPAFTFCGHRGASGEVPANTMESFERTLEIEPAAMLEMDVWQSRDGEIIVSHDETLASQTDGTGLIREYSFEELKSFDAGYTFSPDGGKSFPARGRGLRFPSLEEVLTRFPESRLSIDIKRNDEDFARSVLKTIRARGAEDRVSIGSFHPRIIALVRREFPRLCTTFGPKEIISFLILQKLGLSGFARPKSDVIMICEFTDTELPEYLGGGVNQGVRIITPQFIKAAHRKGIPVYAWTINRRENMERLISWGIDGIITDYPSVLAEVLRK
jgi:glycerophosphoryl diester phosphodiesterase